MALICAMRGFDIMNTTKKHLRRLLCALLSLLLLSSLAVAASAAKPKTKNEVPVIFVAGFMSTKTIDRATGEQLFPPSKEVITAAAQALAETAAKRLYTKRELNWKYPLNQAALRLFDGIRCDEDGVPINSYTGTAYIAPSPKQIREKYHDDVGYTAEDPIYYSYDWRLDLRTLAQKLHDFIEYVCECTGAKKVKLIAHSMGTCVTSTYMYVYGREYLDDVILYMGALNGSSTCGDPFENNLSMDNASIMAAANAMLGTDLKGELLRAALDILYQQGIVGAGVDLIDKMMIGLFDRLYTESLPYIFGRIPGFWALIPAEYYDGVRNEFAAGVVTDTFYKKVDFYHTVQEHEIETFRAMMKQGVGISVLTKYGYPLAPIVDSRENDSDFVVDVKYSSLGATCANYDETLPDSYVQQLHPEKNYISPDRKIDASTCAFPDQTWFVKNSSHTDTITSVPLKTRQEQQMLQWILCADGQPTVWDNPAYPQYMVYLPDGSLAPLTAENNCDILGNRVREEGFAAQAQQIVADLRYMVTVLFQAVKPF